MKEDYFDADCVKCYNLFPTIWKTCEAPTSKECLLRDWAKCKACENRTERCKDCIRHNEEVDDVIEQAFREGLQQGRKNYDRLLSKLKEVIENEEATARRKLEEMRAYQERNKP